MARAPRGNRSKRFNPVEFLQTAAKGRRVTSYKKNDVIFTQGDPADSVFYIKSGNVQVSVISNEGKEAIIALLGADEFIGEGSLIGQPKCRATAKAMNPCVVMRVGKDEMVRVLQDEITFVRMFLTHILERNSRIEADLVDQLFNSSEKRLARVLLLMANFGQDGQPQKLVAKISQDTLAKMIGTTRSRVSYFMNKFRELGFVEYTGTHFEVHSSLLGVVLENRPRSVEREEAPPF